MSGEIVQEWEVSLKLATYSDERRVAPGEISRGIVLMVGPYVRAKFEEPEVVEVNRLDYELPPKEEFEFTEWQHDGVYLRALDMGEHPAGKHRRDEQLDIEVPPPRDRVVIPIRSD